jgi:hypothetical protein
MVKKIRRVRTFARTASKSMEKKLIENAKNLADDPTIVLPEYSDNFSRKIIEKIKKKLIVISKYKDDSKKLEKLSNKRDLSGALAGTLLVANSEKAPYLAVAKFPTGDITYAQRGRADKEKLISVQHYDDPILRLLGIKDIAQKKKLHIYSWDEGFTSTGKEPNPPKEFVDFIIKKIDLKKNKNILSCGDISQDQIKESKIVKKDYLRIHWQSANIYFGICKDCAKSKKNTIFNITKYMLQPDISSDFIIDVVGSVVKQKDSLQSTKYIDDYLSGKLTDFEFIEKNMKDRESSIKDSEEKIFILDGTSYGDNVEEFIDALSPDKYEREGLKIILDQVKEPVVLNSVTPNKVLEKYWKDYGLSSINSIIKDEEMAKKFYSLDDSPSDILELVFGFKERQKILSELPQYKSLPPLSAFVDNIARTYRTFGEKKAASEIKKRPNNPKGKSLAYAFLLAFGKGTDKKWQFSQVEIEYGEFLKDYVKKLLDAKPSKYHEAFKELIVASGSSENVDDFKI